MMMHILFFHHIVCTQAELLVICQNILIVVDGPSLVATILSCKDKDIIREQGCMISAVMDTA